MSRSRRIATAALAVAALTLPASLLAGCGSQGTATSSSAAAPEPAVAGGGVAAPQADSRALSAGVAGAPADAAPAPEAASKAAAGGAGTAASQALPGSLLQARLVRTAEVVVEVQQLATSAARVRAAAVGLGGLVSSEVTTYAPTGLGGVTGSGSTVPPDANSGSSSSAAGGQVTQVKPGTPGESVIVVRIPVDSLDTALDKVSLIGKELARSSSSQDVTADLADLGSRVKTQQASVDRIRVLLARATSMQDIVLLEGQLTTREADLEALQARQASLADRADLSTLTVTLRTPEAKVADPVEDNGFVAGLKSGWHAVLASTSVVLTVLGALLPLLITAALIGAPVYLLARRRLRRRAQAAPGAQAAPPAPAGVPVSVLLGAPAPGPVGPDRQP